MACIPKQPKTPKQAVFESYVPYNSFKLFIHFCQKHMDLGLAFWGLSTHTPFGLQKQNHTNREISWIRWFKVTFLSPSWRSPNPLKGSLNHPKKVTLNHQEIIRPFFPFQVRHGIDSVFRPKSPQTSKKVVQTHMTWWLFFPALKIFCLCQSSFFENSRQCVHAQHAACSLAGKRLLSSSCRLQRQR